jgi:hypothetical protein
MNKLFNGKSIFSSFGVAIFIFACGIFAQTFAQDQNAIRQAQDEVRNKITRDKGGYVNFSNYAQANPLNNSRTQFTVTGQGTWSRDYNINEQNFSYEARVDTRKNKVDKIKYNLLGNNNGNGNGNGGNVPSWAIGNITLTISNNGSVTVNADGRTNYATLNGDRLTNNGAVARVTRIRNGIRTTSVDNGEYIDYFTDGNYNGNNNGNNNGGNVPSWAIGTFTARNPQSGGNITLTINSNGSVTVNADGRTNYATLNGDRLTNNGAVARVTKIRNGIRTTSVDNGEYIDYFTDGNYNGNGNGNNNGNANVPSWAVGRFYARNPQTGGNITMTISSNGDVEINFDGTTTYANINRDRLFVNGAESKVTKINNGIRTTDVNTGDRIDYRRQDY